MRFVWLAFGVVLASALLATGVAEGVVRAKYCGVACQSRLDWLNPERGIVDLKTCDNLDWLEMDARGYGYTNQLAFYRSMLGKLGQYGVYDIDIAKYRIALEEPVYDPEGKPRADFFTA